MTSEPDKPQPNTLLILFTLFDLVAAAAGAAPFIMASLISADKDATGNSDFLLLMSVPATAVILVFVAWTLQATGRPKAARIIAGLPLLWGMTVLVMQLGANV